MNRSSARRHPAVTLAGAACLALLAMPVAAQTMKPGLWEITNKVGGSGDMGAKMAAAQAQMQKQLASMPPEQRKQMEKMMAQQGVNMSPGASGMSTRICMTREMAARNQPPAQNRGDCKQEQMQRSGNTTKFKFTCANPPSSGEGTVTMHNPESYSMNMKVSRQAGGKAEQMTMEAQGKWLGNDCGSVKPVK